MHLSIKSRALIMGHKSTFSTINHIIFGMYSWPQIQPMLFVSSEKQFLSLCLFDVLLIEAFQKTSYIDSTRYLDLLHINIMDTGVLQTLNLWWSIHT